MDAPRMMITGAHGFVGARAMEKFPMAIPVPGELVRRPGEPLAEYIRAQQPDVIVNAAAISDIGACAKDPQGSYAANVALPVALAKAAREVGAKLISFSSDQVYTGCAHEGPYREDDPLPAPANLYACHKLEAEQRVLDLLPEAILLRATWMYDMPMYGHANRGNFLVNVLQAARRGETLRFSDRTYRGITYVRQVVDLLDPLQALPGGVYNYGSENSLTMYETAQALLRALGLEERAALEKTDEPRHNLWMDGGKLRARGIAFDTTQEGFTRCLRDYGWQ